MKSELQGAATPAWIGQLPEGWEPLRLKHLTELRTSNVDKKSHDDEIRVQLCNYTDVYYNERITSDMEFMEATATRREIDRFRLMIDDVVVTKDSESWDDIAIPAHVAEDLRDVVCAYHLAILRPEQARIDGRFLLRALQANGVREQFHIAATGITRYGLSQRAIGTALIPVPPLVVQRAIADFLDRKTAAIDVLIWAKERLIALLQEKRQALITQAVTKGLDPSVPMKDSGIEWLGEVPAHWEVVQLRRTLQDIEQGWSPQAIDRRVEADEWGVIRLSAVTGGVFRPEEHKALPATSVPDPGLAIQQGDVLVTRANTPDLVGDACYVDSVPNRLIFSDLVYRLTPNGEMGARFLTFWLHSRPSRHQISQDARGSSQSMVKIGQKHILAWATVVPPLAEQDMIVDHISARLAKIESVQRALVAQVKRLADYRQALISATVTGQINVADHVGATAGW